MTVRTAAHALPDPPWTVVHPRGVVLDDVELDRLRDRLLSVRAECEQQMAAASATLAALRESGSVTDPQAQAPLMAALRSLGEAERVCVEVADALARMDAGRFGRCLRCERTLPLERLELHPYLRHCVPCSR